MKIFKIAEIGINHNGDMHICKKLIDVAKEVGFDSVKFQKRDVRSLFKRTIRITSKKSLGHNSTRSEIRT